LVQIVIHTKDVAALKGISNDTALKLLKTIKDVYGKKKHQDVTIREFCEYEDLPYEEVFALINNLTYAP
jgi:hypothetical protein